jgi:hypothetical protein
MAWHIPITVLVLLFLHQVFLSPGLCQEITLSWDGNSETDIAGYKIYYGNRSRHYGHSINVGNVAEHAFIPLSGIGTLYLAVTAYDTVGNESGYSEEVTIETVANTLNEFSLMPNYPNPFNPVTCIPYFLRSRLRIKLAIYNVLGREVKLLDEGEKEPGLYTTVWDGTDNSGYRTANGVYFCRLVVGNYCNTKKLILAR